MLGHFEAHPELELADAAYTTQVGRKAFDHRRFVVARDLTGAASAAEALREGDPRRTGGAVRQAEDRPVTFVLPAELDPEQRSGRDLYRGERAFRETADAACDLLSDHLGTDLREALFGAGAAGPDPVLPGAAAFVVSYALAALLREWGIQPASAIGTGATGPLADCLLGTRTLEDAAALAAASLRGAGETTASGRIDPEPLVLELGPGGALPAAGGDALPSILAALGRLWAEGVTVDWERFNADERRQRARLPAYPFERQRYWIDRGKGSPVAVSATGVVKDPRIENWFYVPVWKSAPLPAEYGRTREAGPVRWLVWEDEAGLGDTLAGRLQARGDQVSRVVPGEAWERADDGTYTVRPASREDYERLFQDLEKRGEVPGRILHLWTLTSGGEPVDRLETLGFRSLLYLTQAFTRHGAMDEVDVALISNGLHDIDGSEELHPVKTTLLGLAQVIRQEFLNIVCRSIDLEAMPAGAAARERMADRLLTELDAASTEPVVALRNGRRWVHGFDPVRLPARPEGATAFRQGGVYLLTGGLGHIGSILSEHLARHFQARLVLVGRSGLPERETWDGWLTSHPESDAVSKRIRRVRQLEELGAEVLVAGADVADPARMKEVVDLAVGRFGALNGVVHAAGWIGAGAFNAIQDMREEQAGVHFAPKVLGALSLARALEGRELDFCVLTSSLSAVLGGLGHGAYSAANRFLDALAQLQSRRTGAHWLSINWDTWLYDEETEAQTGRGATLAALNMTFDEGVETLERALLLGRERQVAVSTGNLQARLDQWVRLDSARSREDAPARHPRPALDNPYVSPATEQEGKVAEIWQDVLGIDQVGVHDNFFDLGGHSLLATQLFFRLRQTFRTELPLKVLFEAPTVAEMSRVITASQEPGGAEAVAEILEIDWSRETQLDPAIVPAPASEAAGERREDHLFLTGGTGFLGAFVLSELLRATEAQLHCLVRADGAAEGVRRLRRNLEQYDLWEDSWADRIVPVTGDLTESRFGLSAAEFDALADRMDAVYHGGAVVNFLYPYSQSRSANVLGTQEALRLASHRRAKPYHQVSTTGVIAPRYRGQGSPIREDQILEHPEELNLGYTQSKWVAERLVREAASRGLATGIYRPGAISGHSRTGACQTNDFYWLLIKACLQIGGVPNGNLPLPLTPVDYVSRAIVHLSRQDGWQGKVFHLVNPSPFTLRDLVAWMESFGYSLEWLAYDEWRERLIQGMKQSGGNAAHALLALFPESALGVAQNGMGGGVSAAPIDASNTLAGIAGSDVACPTLDAALLERYFTYFIRTRYIDPPAVLQEKTA
jgi:thioester reductase-like protein